MTKNSLLLACIAALGLGAQAQAATALERAAADAQRKLHQSFANLLGWTAPSGIILCQIEVVKDSNEGDRP